MGQVYFVILRLPGEGVQLYHTNRHVMNLLDIVIRTIESINHEMAFGEARSKGFLQGLEMKRGCTNKSSQEQKTRLEQMPMESQLLKRHLGQREEILAR
ncbi:hypothetical protein PENSUB_11315 [Penicillium subrubescens]|uniref:Uncharacterized protein n=1 Tax=Penicillium subrubescens TaxID=1316194 RepID=A0A1Q5T4B0_9EURO|nr:hypothetical protein PENSUB_11315 [Penicillium subrubescens]